MNWKNLRNNPPNKGYYVLMYVENNTYYYVGSIVKFENNRFFSCDEGNAVNLDYFKDYYLNLDEIKIA